MEEQRVVITAEQAKSLLVNGDTAHCFANPAGILIGADWSRSDAEEYIDTAKQIEIAGTMAKGMNHALAVFGDSGLYFFETDSSKVNEFEKTLPTSEAESE